MKICRELFPIGTALLFLISILFAQSPDTLWTRTYGGIDWDGGLSMQQTTDSGYIVVGYTESFNADSEDVYLIKTDTNGIPIWSKTYGGEWWDCGRSVQQTTGGGYIIAGFSWYAGAGGTDVYVIKTDSSGDTLWTRIYGGSHHDEGYSIQQTKDSSYIVAGYTIKNGGFYQDVYLLKIDSLGDTLWTRTYGGDYSEEGHSVKQTSDGGYIVTGFTTSYGAGCADIYLVKTDSLGDTLWTSTFGGTLQEWGESVLETFDGKYIVVGYTYSFGVGHTDIYIIAIDSLGNELWSKTYGGPYQDEAHSIQETSDGNYIIAGFTRCFGAGYDDVYLLKINPSGDSIWTTTFGGADFDRGYSVQQTFDNGYIIAGITESFSVGMGDVYLIKTEPDVGIEEDKKDQRAKTTDMKLTASPNPFTASTTIHLKGAQAHKNTKAQEIEIFEISGRKIRSIMPCDGCSGALLWDGKDVEGKEVKAGIYFLKADGKYVGKVVKVR